MMPLLMITDGFYAEFYGWDVVLFYIYSAVTFMQQYSWQVRLSYGIILACVAVMTVLMFLFAKRFRQRRKHQENYDHCYNTYGEPFIEILEDKTLLSKKQMLEIIDEDERGLARYDGMIYAEVLVHIRMTMNTELYIPNLQHLCELTGALDAIEQRLGKRKDVFRALQMVNTFPLVINEGLLSIYTAHSNPQIATLARVAHCMCSKTEPYLYFLEDMNKPHSSWYRITFHRILGWRKEQHYPMAPLLMLAQRAEDVKMASFLVEEVAYWGTAEEIRKLPSFFNDPRVPCRIAAIRSLARLRYADAEELIMQSYESQPQEVRREMQKAIASFHSGKYVDFFVNLYLNTPSHISRCTALEALYDYNEEGRMRFEQLAAEADEQDVVLFNQIRTLHQLRH